jgi:hypothetical protein
MLRTIALRSFVVIVGSLGTLTSSVVKYSTRLVTVSFLTD